jgi:serine phosphatase RsbU (regulator of sigma subunit)/tetratricopeptide (TPR) repeat protein
MKFRFYIFFLSLAISLNAQASKSNLDSLMQLLSNPNIKTQLWSLEEISSHYLYINNDSCIKYSKIGIEIAEKANRITKKGSFLITLGNAYVEKSNFAKALDSYVEAEKCFKETKNIHFAITAINNIGYVYEHQNLPETAIMQYETALAVATKVDDKEQIADSYSFLGSVFYNKYEDEKALDNFTKALEINRELKRQHKVIDCLNNIAIIYKDAGKLDEALNIFFQLLDYSRKNNDLFKQIIAYHNIAITYQSQNNTLNTIVYLDSSAALAQQTRDFEKLITIYSTFTDLFSKQNNTEKAFEYFKLQYAAKDSLLQQSREKQFIEMSTKYGSEKKEAENKLLKTESEKQKAISIGISIGLALFGLLSFFIFRSYKQKQKANILLAAQNNEINEKKNIIEEKQKEILDSISYAKRLQEAILPPIDSLNKYFESAFIYYKPKDIVAGDFYWMENRNDYTFIAAADCTGHGVPGAMVSVVCSNALNRAVLEFDITDPGKILDKTRDLVLETFSKSDKDVKDGMDISLVAIHNKTKELKWAGANNRLWYTQDDKMAEITANKQPIGKTEVPTPFTTHTIQLQKNSSLFLFTDGYADQFGGPKGKKFKYKELQSILLQNATLSSSEQSEKLNAAFTNWKGNLEQVDDVCVIGLRV